MRLSQWQLDKALVKSAKDIRDSEFGGRWFEMLSAESPANLPSFVNQTESEHSRRLGFIEGYHYCMRVLEASWTKPVKVKEVEATFEQPKE